MLGIKRSALDIFTSARGLKDPEARAAYLQSACGDDLALRRRIEALLRADDSAGQFLLPAAPAMTGVVVPDPLAPGARIGEYTLLEKLGEGGFGAVWRAEQRTPLVRQVALKMLKPGMDSRSVLARFDAERQLLALMEHPGIARVLAAGATELGRPYVVMELVRGAPITTYCDQNCLPLRARLDLFLQVCRALQHAHQRGVIHRDIKPSNVLVTEQDGAALPKIIDFGIAKATDASVGAPLTLSVRLGLLGTPAYMSPEQADWRALAIDTRADIYSLGALLYELLTGMRLFDDASWRSAGYVEMIRVLCEQMPIRPSVRVADESARSEIAAVRSTSVVALQRALRGDLDWIVMKCLAKDREQRYATVGALADDIARHLNAEPVMAGPPTTGYRVRKFVERHRRAVVLSASVAVLLIAATATSVTFAWTAGAAQQRTQGALADREVALASAREQQRATKAALDQAEAINRFVTQALSGADPEVGGTQELTVRGAMNQAIQLLDGGELGEQPLIEAALRRTIARVLEGNGRPQEALEQATAALALFRAHDGPASADVALTQAVLGRCYDRLGQPEEALSAKRAALLLYEEALGDEQSAANCRNDVGVTLSNLGRNAEALSYYEAALETNRRLHPSDHETVATSLSNVAQVLNELGRSAEALEPMREAVAMLERLQPGDSLQRARATANLGGCYAALGRDREALDAHVAARDMIQRRVRTDHPDLATAMNNVATCLVNLGRGEEALPVHEAALAMRKRLFGLYHPDTATSLNNVAGCLAALGRFAAALPNFEAALDVRTRLQGPDHPDLALQLNNVAFALQRLDRPAEALPKLQQALELFRRAYPGDHPAVSVALGNTGGCLRELGRAQEGLALCEESLDMAQRLFSGDHPRIAGAMYHRGRCCEGLARLDEAQSDYAGSLTMYQRLLPATHPQPLYPQLGLARILIRRGQFKDAEAQLTAAAAVCEQSAAAGNLHREAVLSLFDELYQQWNVAAPEVERSERAANWKARRQPIDVRHSPS